MTFSQRYGFESKKVFQKEDIDKDLRVGIWNVIFIHEFNRSNMIYYNSIVEKIWINYYKEDFDRFTQTTSSKQLKLFKYYFMELEWNEIYDVIEFLIENSKNRDILKEKFNEVLIKENSAYRIVDSIVVPIVEDIEIECLDETLNIEFDVVKNQIKNALILLSDREKPDYKNSFKEAISAVESMCKIILDKDNVTLGQALNQIEKMNDFELNGALKSAFSSIYGFASNEVRHGKIKESEVDYDLAKYMVISCSAFINYLISKYN